MNTTMPNTKGGKKYKSRHPTSTESTGVLPELDTDGSQLYGLVTKLVGAGRMVVMCHDKKERLCKICGSMRKRVWTNAGDLVKISTREWDVSVTENGLEKGDIIMKLTQDQEKTLRKDERYAFLAGMRGGKSGTATIEDGIVFDDGHGESESEEDVEKDAEPVVKTSKKVGGKSAVTKEVAVEIPDDFNVDDI